MFRQASFCMTCNEQVLKNNSRCFCSLSFWVPDVYNNDIIMYLVHVHCTIYMYQIMVACHASTVHVYDLLHKLSIAYINYLR